MLGPGLHVRFWLPEWVPRSPARGTKIGIHQGTARISQVPGQD